MEREHRAFLDELLMAQEDADASQVDYLKALGGDGLHLLLQETNPPADLLDAYIDLVVARKVHASKEVLLLLNEQRPSGDLLTLALIETIEQAERRFAQNGTVSRGQNHDRDSEAALVVRRVVQISEYRLSNFRVSDALGIKRSVFRSEQERTFLQALSLRFPGLHAFPNYPLDQFADFHKLRDLVDSETLEYGKHCRVDAVLVVPGEGDPVAAFELDSALHDDPAAARKDRLRNRLFRAIQIPFFRLRAEQNCSVGIDEWYALLTEQVATKIDCGPHLRIRTAHRTLVPI
jgi:hypothetical protein